jgi:hypothetical protein
MNIRELNRNLKIKLKGNKRVMQIIHPWDLLKFRYVNYLEVMGYGGGYFLQEKNGQWETWFQERTTRFEVRKFDSEEEACMYFYSWIVSCFK